MNYESFLNPGEPVNGKDALIIRDYINVIDHADEARKSIRDDCLTVRLEKQRAIDDDMKTRCTELAKALGPDGTGALVKVLAKRFSVELDLVNTVLYGIGPIHDISNINEAAPAWHEFLGRCQNGWRDAHDAHQAAELSQAKEILGDRWRDGPVDAREWMAVIIGGPAADKHADKVLRAWSAYVGAREFLRLDRDDEKEIASVKPTHPEQLAKWEGAQQFVDGYSIGNPPPTCIEAILVGNFDKHWPEGRRFETDREKVLAVLKWHPFWQQHGPAYLKARKKEEGAAKHKAPGGEERAKRREEDRWTAYTRGFKKSAGQKTITVELINKYPKQPGVIKVKGEHFLATLLKAKGNDEVFRDMANLLELKNTERARDRIILSQATIEKCFAILFPPVNEKKSPVVQIS